MNKNHTPGRRLTPKEVQDALYYWHLFDGNASKVAEKLDTSVKTITALARRENFEGKRVLVQNQVNEMVYNTDDPMMQRLAAVDIKTLEVTELLINQVLKGVRRRTIKIRNVTEAMMILKGVTEIRSKILGVSKGDGEREPTGINIGSLNFIDLPSSKRDELIKVLTSRAQVIEGRGEVVESNSNSR